MRIVDGFVLEKTQMKKLKLYLPRIYLFLRAFLIVLFVTSNVYLIANKYYVAVICLSAGISLM